MLFSYLCYLLPDSFRRHFLTRTELELELSVLPNVGKR